MIRYPLAECTHLTIRPRHNMKTPSQAEKPGRCFFVYRFRDFENLACHAYIRFGTKNGRPFPVMKGEPQ